MIEQSLNYASSTVKEMVNPFETSVDNLKHKEEKNKFSAASKNKGKEKSPNKKRKQADFYFSVVEPVRSPLRITSLKLHGTIFYTQNVFKLQKSIKI